MVRASCTVRILIPVKPVNGRPVMGWEKCVFSFLFEFSVKKIYVVEAWVLESILSFHRYEIYINEGCVVFIS